MLNVMNVSDVLKERIWDKVTIVTYDNVKLYDGDAFGIVNENLLSLPVYRVVTSDGCGYECVRIELQENNQTIPELLEEVEDLKQQIRELEYMHAVNASYIDSMHERSTEHYENIRMAMHVIEFAIRKKQVGKKVNLQKII